jgi:hypothetical protein
MGEHIENWENTLGPSGTGVGDTLGTIIIWKIQHSDLPTLTAKKLKDRAPLGCENIFASVECSLFFFA